MNKARPLDLKQSRSSLQKWLSALFGLGLTVAAVQGLSFVANIIVVRSLPVAEYALLTSSLSLLGILTAIADSGLSQAALTVGGIHHQSHDEKAQVLQRCRRLVLVTGCAGLCIIMPLWVWMAIRLHVSVESAVAVGIVLFGGFFLVLGVNIMKSMMLLEGYRLLIQKVDVAKTVIRLLMLVSGIALFPSAAYVILCAFLVEIIPWITFRRTLWSLINVRPACTPEISGEIKRVWGRLMPVVVYRAVSSQIFLLLLVALGSAVSVAGAGALSKFQQCFIMIPSVVAMVFSPRVARSKGYRQRNAKFLGFTALGWIGAGAVWFLLVILAGPLLSLLGGDYAGLQNEMRIYISGSCLFTMTGVIGALLNMRGWLMPPQLYIGADLVSMMFAIYLCDPSSLMGFVTMTFILNAGLLLAYVGWTGFCLLFRREVALA